MQHPESDRDRIGGEHTTSLSLGSGPRGRLASARLDPSKSSVDIWDPAAGSGFAGSLLLEALRSAGVQTRYRGQDINEAAVAESRRRFDAFPDVEVALGDTLAHDAFEDFVADLVIVDAPWGMDWRAVGGGCGSVGSATARSDSASRSAPTAPGSSSLWRWRSCARRNRAVDVSRHW